jgi:lipoprotein-releasing system permease protein
MVVGLFGNLIGLLAGLTAIHYRNPFREWLKEHGINAFPVGIYEFEGIPAEVVPHDVTIICVSAFIICSLAALVPAYIASQLDPVEALRYE